MTEEPAFITVAYLYAKTSRSGRPFLFGVINGLRIYAFYMEDRVPKDAKPELRLCVRHADYERIRGKLPEAFAVAAPDRDSSASR